MGRIKQPLSIKLLFQLLKSDLKVTCSFRKNSGAIDLVISVARVNLHHVVFTARAPETEIVFDNSDAKVGEELGINAVSLNPYFEGSAGDME